MGLIKAVKDAIGSSIADQYKEYFYCDSLADNVLVVKGKKRVTSGRNNNNNTDNIISNGSAIAVNEGQCMIIVDQGGVVELCADPGEFIYDSSTEPSIFCGDLGEGIRDTFKTMWRRTTFGGNTAKDQRVYFFNTKEILNNPFGTQNPVPFRVIDRNIGLDVDISVRCNGLYSYKLVDPLLFYKNVCGNVTEAYTRDRIAGMMKSELLTALAPALAKVSALGVRYSEVPAHNKELAKALNEELSEQWTELRGIEIVSMTINDVIASEEDQKRIKELQETAVLRNAGMAAATLTAAQAEAMKAAASNTATGPMMAFAGMNMANMTGGMDANALFQMDGQNMQQGMNGQQMNGMMGQQMNGMNGRQMPNMQSPGQASQRTPILGWNCSCGKTDNRGKFCEECGSPKPVNAGWTCSCGTVNQGKFCAECGSRKPEGAPLYKCDKCGWEPEDPTHPPKFCPECGDIFDENDRV